MQSEPNEAQRRLEKLQGEWEGEERIHPSPFDPAGGTAIARVSNRLALDGRAVVQDYEQERNGTVSFRGHGVFHFDPSTSEYGMMWFDSWGMGPGDYRGTFENDLLVLSFRSPQGISRATFDLSSADTYDYRMEVSPDGESWFPFMEGSYRRKT